LNWVYPAIGREKDANMILLPLLKGMSDGGFQGRCANGRTKDWKTWSGECRGYEGFLVDNYMFLLCAASKIVPEFHKCSYANVLNISCLK
jgi:hypothetical protein